MAKNNSKMNLTGPRSQYRRCYSCRGKGHEIRSCSNMSLNSDSVTVGEIRLPAFSGKVEDFPDFRFQFQDLRENFDCPPFHLLALLRERIPHNMKSELQGIRSVDEAWALMEERFGDMDLLVKVVRDNLYQLKLTGDDNDQILSLCSKVKSAELLISPSSLSAELGWDTSMIPTLVMGLPDYMQYDWQDFAFSNMNRDR